MSRSGRLLAALKALPRRARLLAIPVVTAGLVACGGGHDHYYDDGYYDDPACSRANYPAVAVYFVDAVSGQPVLVGALGSVTTSVMTEEMTSPEPGYAADGRTTVLQGAFGQTGFFNVSVVTHAGERYDWANIRVDGNACQIFTANLQAPVRYPN